MKFWVGKKKQSIWAHHPKTSSQRYCSAGANLYVWCYCWNCSTVPLITFLQFSLQGSVLLGAISYGKLSYAGKEEGKDPLKNPVSYQISYIVPPNKVNLPEDHCYCYLTYKNVCISSFHFNTYTDGWRQRKRFFYICQSCFWTFRRRGMQGT